MSPTRSARFLVLIAATGLIALGGCGRRGPLEAPHGVADPTSEAVPAAPRTAEHVQPSDKPDKPFVLDPLI